MQRVLALWEKLTAAAGKAGWVGPLLARITLGVVFAVSGWGKLNNIEGVIKWFGEDLGLPAPAFHAYLVGFTELVGGVALVLGLATRFFALPLAVTMVMALGTGGAFDEPPSNILDVLGTEEAVYLAALVWLALAGAGAASGDALVRKAFAKRALP